MKSNIYEIYFRTLNNCKFLEAENKKIDLINEIGCLRGIVYCIEAQNNNEKSSIRLSDEFQHYIYLKNNLVTDVYSRINANK